MMYLSFFWKHFWDVCTLVLITSHFLVCLSVCYLAHLLIEMMSIKGYLQFCVRYLSEIFWRHSWDVCTLVLNIFQCFVFLLVYYLTHFLSEIMSLQRYLQFWIIYLSEISWRHSWDVGILFPNNSEFHVCLSVCQFAYFLTEIIQIQGYFQFWKRYISEIFLRHSWDVGTLIPNNIEILVCLSVWYLAYFLTEIKQKYR